MSDRGKRAWVFLGLACFLAGMFILVEQAGAHNLPGTEHNRGTRSRTPSAARSGRARWATRRSTSPTASRGRTSGPALGTEATLGLFQVDSLWRSEIAGWSWSPWAQARHAYRIWLRAGWGPWDCA